jgi:RNA polymerase sigma factor (sigma-70 family)
MAADGLRAEFRRLRRLADPGSSGLSDGELLERYARNADEAAFELLLWRHGPMVYGACRRMLRRDEDAEDAFQATFLTLVRKSNSVRRGGAVGAWLYQVAYRIALRARSKLTPVAEQVVEPAANTADDSSWRELSPIIDEEIRRLPARYREPVVLCYLEGRTHSEAARELGCPKGTVAIRLLRARKLLQKRLTRRGVTLAGGLVALAAIPSASAALVARTLRTAFGGPVPVRVISLSEGVIRAMSFTRVKAAIAALLLTTGLLAASTAFLSREAPPQDQPPPEPERSAPPAQSTPALAEQVARVPALRDGVVQFVGAEIAPGESVPAEHRIVAETGKLLIQMKEGESGKGKEVILGVAGTRWRPWRDDDPVEPGRLMLYRIKKGFRRLNVGDKVKAGELVGHIDPSLALADLAIKLASLEARESERRVSVKTKEEAERRLAAMEESMRRVPGSVSKDDYEGAKLTVRRYQEEVTAKQGGVRRTAQEVIQAATILSMHEVRTPLSGTIRTLESETGDAVKALDTVMSVGPPLRSPNGAAGAVKERVVRSLHDGVLVVVGTPLKNSEVVPSDDTLAVTGGGKTVRYRRMRVGDTVEAGQLIARLDDRLARSEVSLLEASLEAANADRRSAIKAKEEAERRVSAMEESMRRIPGSVSKDDYEGAKLIAKRYFEEAIAFTSAVRVCEEQIKRARTVLAGYEIHSPVGGVVREVLKQAGEAVHPIDPILRIAPSAKP